VNVNSTAVIPLIAAPYKNVDSGDICQRAPAIILAGSAKSPFTVWYAPKLVPCAFSPESSDVSARWLASTILFTVPYNAKRTIYAMSDCAYANPIVCK